MWQPAFAGAEVPVDATSDDLRHTFASTALAEGMPISEVSRWLDHKPITTTVDLYGTWSPRQAVTHATRSAGHSTHDDDVPPKCPGRTLCRAPP
jgi:integrase